MAYLMTFFGVLLKAITVAILQLTGTTPTSGIVTKGVNIIMLILILKGIITTCNQEKGSELVKCLLLHGVIIGVGFLLSWLLTWSLIIGIGGFFLVGCLIMAILTGL